MASGAPVSRTRWRISRRRSEVVGCLLKLGRESARWCFIMQLRPNGPSDILGDGFYSYLEMAFMLCESSKKCLTDPSSSSDKAFLAITDEINCIFSWEVCALIPYRGKESSCHGLPWQAVTTEGILLSRSTVTAFIQNRKILHANRCELEKQYLNRPQVMNWIEQNFKIQMRTRFRLLININQLVAPVVEGATRASWLKWVLAWASNKLGELKPSFCLNTLLIRNHR